MRYLTLNDGLHAYQLGHRSPEDPLDAELRAETQERFGRAAGMQIGPDQGAFLQLLTAAMGVRRALEVGTFTGYSSLCVARSLPADGQLICCDVSEEFTSLARKYWEKAGVADRIDLRLGPALDTLRALPDEPAFDFAFIDADKPGYVDYYEEVLKRLRPGGVIAIDNVLWGGRIVDGQDDQTAALRRINEHVTADARVQSVMLPIGDGVTLARKL